MFIACPKRRWLYTSDIKIFLGCMIGEMSLVYLDRWCFGGTGSGRLRYVIDSEVEVPEIKQLERGS